jgi:addiction module HigA family antidote
VLLLLCPPKWEGLRVRKSNVRDRGLRAGGEEAIARNPNHPGATHGEGIEELGVSGAELSRHICAPANRISRIINVKHALAGDMALRLAHWADVRPQRWLNLQALYDVGLAAQDAGRAIESLPERGAKPKAARSRPV